MKKLATLSLLALLGVAGDATYISESSRKKAALEKFKNKYEEVLHIDKIIPAGSEVFQNTPGTMVYSSRSEGIDYLVNKAKNSRIEEIWMYIPSESLWINTSREATEISALSDGFLDYTGFMLSLNLEIYHVHIPLKKRSDIKNVEWVLENHGPMGEFLPSVNDIHTALIYAHTLPNNITHGVVSAEGVMKYYIAPSPQHAGRELHPFMQTIIAMSAEALSERTYNFFKDCAVEDIKTCADNYNDIMLLDFEPYVRK
ncbi:MAG TPA: hypothetical protein VEC16_06435 [Alphaproteobacteria bacterium]|nr:hypothetical protein [Alphaproteobacteria bacterium]